jgi:hypothetical protein
LFEVVAWAGLAQKSATSLTKGTLSVPGGSTCARGRQRRMATRPLLNFLCVAYELTPRVLAAQAPQGRQTAGQPWQWKPRCLSGQPVSEPVGRSA